MIKSKTLIKLAVASTFGLSAAAFAGNGHEVSTPFSPNEFGNVGIAQEQLMKSDAMHTSSMGSSSSHAGGTVTGSSDTFSGFAPSASREGSTEWLALGDEGTYSDYYLVSLTPELGLGDGWDYYLIDVDPEQQLSFSEETYFLMPTYDLVLIEDLGQDVASDLGE